MILKTSLFPSKTEINAQEKGKQNEKLIKSGDGNSGLDRYNLFHFLFLLLWRNDYTVFRTCIWGE